MSAEYLSNPNTPPQPPKRDNRVVILLAAILALLLAIITAVVVIFAIRAKNNNGEVNETSSSSDVVTEEQPTAELSTLDIFASTESTTGLNLENVCPICKSSSITNPDANGFKTCNECGAKWAENGGSTSSASQKDQHTQSTGATVPTAKPPVTERPTPTRPTVTERPTPTEKPISNVKVGDYIKFGKYEQDNNTSNGKEAIEWLVLDVQGDKALVISKYVLDAKHYNKKNENIVWERCTLRSWLNNDFYNAAFTSNEKSRISDTVVVAEDNPNNGIDAGNNTRDKVFLLSCNEAKRYFASDDARKCKPTAYAKAQGAWYTKKTESGNYGNGCWWLRTPGIYGNYACPVEESGYIDDSGNFVTYVGNGIRPAMWISI